jgi:hypothetical protein
MHHRIDITLRKLRQDLALMPFGMISRCFVCLLALATRTVETGLPIAGGQETSLTVMFFVRRFLRRTNKWHGGYAVATEHPGEYLFFVASPIKS